MNFAHGSDKRVEWRVRYQTKWGIRNEYRLDQEAAGEFAEGLDDSCEVLSIEQVERALDY